MSECSCQNGFVFHEVPGGAHQAFRCPCPKGEQHKVKTRTTGFGKKKRTVTYTILTHEEARAAVRDAMPLQHHAQRLSAPSARDRAAGEKDFEGEV